MLQQQGAPEPIVVIQLSGVLSGLIKTEHIGPAEVLELFQDIIVPQEIVSFTEAHHQEIVLPVTVHNQEREEVQAQLPQEVLPTEALEVAREIVEHTEAPVAVPEAASPIGVLPLEEVVITLVAEVPVAEVAEVTEVLEVAQEVLEAAPEVPVVLQDHPVEDLVLEAVEEGSNP